MTNYVYDFADARPSQATLAGGVAIGVARYVKKSLPNTFELSLQERDQYLAWQLGVLYNAEQGNTDIVAQPTSYWHDYGQEVKELLQSWGVSSICNVAASADQQVPQAQTMIAINNFSAFASAVAPYGMIGYAQLSLLNILVADEISPKGSKHWLPGAIGWSGFPNTAAGWNTYMAYPHAGMVQMLGSNIAGTDMNYLIDPTAMGFDWPVGSPFAPKEEEMLGFLAVDPTTGELNVFDLYFRTRWATPYDAAFESALQVLGYSAQAWVPGMAATPLVGAPIVPITVAIPPIPFPSYTSTPSVPTTEEK